MTEKVLTVITPSMRTLRLPAVAASIAAAAVPDGWRLRWLVGYNPPWAIPWEEHIKRWDELIHSVGSGYWIIVSDDNLLHSMLPWALAEICNSRDQDPRVVGFSQVKPTGVIRHISDSIVASAGELDGGQFVVDAEWYKFLGFRWDQFGMERLLFQKLREIAGPERCVFDPRPFTLYDGQRNRE